MSITNDFLNERFIELDDAFVGSPNGNRIQEQYSYAEYFLDCVEHGDPWDQDIWDDIISEITRLNPHIKDGTDGQCKR